MKKILVLLLLMVSTSVFAEWSKLGGSSDKESTVYVDYGTIKKKGNKVKMWSLIDYKTVHEVAGKKYLSVMGRNEYDCEEETSRLLDFHYHSGNMRQGESVLSDTNLKEEATSIVPESIDETFFKIACDKK
jgi:hypothetical protein